MENPSPLALYQNSWSEDQKDKLKSKKDDRNLGNNSSQQKSVQVGKKKDKTENNDTFMAQFMFKEANLSNIALKLDNYDKEFFELSRIIQQFDKISESKAEMDTKVKKQDDYYNKQIAQYDAEQTENQMHLDRLTEPVNSGIGKEIKQKLKDKCKNLGDSSSVKIGKDQSKKELIDEFKKKQVDIKYTEQKYKDIPNNTNAIAKQFQEYDLSIVLNSFILNTLISKVPNLHKIKLEEKIYKPLQDLRGNVQNYLSQILNMVKKFMDKIPDHFYEKQLEVKKRYKLPEYNSNIDPTENIQFSAMNQYVSYNELRRLGESQLINDLILSVYSAYLRMIQKLTRPGDGDIFIILPFFFAEFLQGTNINKRLALDLLESYYPLKDFFNPEIVSRFGFIVNLSLYGTKHWVFLGVCNKKLKITYYDSMNSSQHFDQYTKPLKKFLNDISGKDFSTQMHPNIPRQQNGYDCGMYVVKFMQNFVYEQEQNFDQQHITLLRERLYTFFPMLAYMQERNKLEIELLQYFEGVYNLNYKEEIKNVRDKVGR